jgi:RimJ/RimL family protein N-acetyltransferase
MSDYPERVETARLLLTRITDADFPDLLAMNQDPRVMATLGGLRPDEFWQARHVWNLNHWREHGFGWWVARTLEDGRFAGRGGLRRAVVDGKDDVELGYGLVPEFWGEGLAGEIAKASIRAGFDVLGLQSIACFTLPTNRRSQRVMEKAGFTYVKDFVWMDLPHVLYRLPLPARPSSFSSD